MDIQLKRLRSDANGTWGEMWNGDNKLCCTVELPWKDNHPQTSCIPTGTWTFNKYDSPKHGWVWMTDDVPGRELIEIHNANFPFQLKGCVGVGSEFGVIEGEPAVLNSLATLEKLRGELSDSFSLTVTGP